MLLEFSAEKLAARRRIVGLSIEDLAERAGISSAYLLSIERAAARPSPQVAERLAAALRVPLVEFVPDAERLDLATRQALYRRITLAMPYLIDVQFDGLECYRGCRRVRYAAHSSRKPTDDERRRCGIVSWHVLARKRYLHVVFEVNLNKCMVGDE